LTNQDENCIINYDYERRKNPRTAQQNNHPFRD
jgi:hypothetical protein